MNTYNKIKWFVREVRNGSVFGGRTSYPALNYSIKDKDQCLEFLKTFYIEVPPMPWLGEKDGHYFLLKKSWMALYDILVLLNLFKHNPITSFKYIMPTVSSIKNINQTHIYYSNPKNNYEKIN